MDTSFTFHGDGGEVYRLVRMPSAKGSTWVLTALRVERPSRRWRRRGPVMKPHRPVTRKR